MSRKPTVTDAQLIIQLYDLRREAEMRKAREWWIGEFFPQTADDFLKVVWAMGTQENRWLRQVSGYWGMVTSFVLRGVLNEDLFLEAAFSGEFFLMFAKIQPLLKELRTKLEDEQFFRNAEIVATRTKFGRERLKFLAKRIEKMRQKAAERKAS
jgi:hypothetical protein